MQGCNWCMGQKRWESQYWSLHKLHVHKTCFHFFTHCRNACTDSQLKTTCFSICLMPCAQSIFCYSYIILEYLYCLLTRHKMIWRVYFWEIMPVYTTKCLCNKMHVHFVFVSALWNHRLDFCRDLTCNLQLFAQQLCSHNCSDDCTNIFDPNSQNACFRTEKIQHLQNSVLDICSVIVSQLLQFMWEFIVCWAGLMAA